MLGQWTTFSRYFTDVDLVVVEGYFFPRATEPPRRPLPGDDVFEGPIPRRRYLLLRTTVKRRVPPDIDLVQLRRHYEEIDRRKFGVPPDVTRTHVIADDVSCEWVDVPSSRPERILPLVSGLVGMAGLRLR